MATYTPYPDTQKFNVAQLIQLLDNLVAICRRLRQYMYRVLNTAQVQAPAAARPAGMSTINPQTINAIMGKLPAKRDEITFWIAQKTNQLEAVCPYTTP